MERKNKSMTVKELQKRLKLVEGINMQLFKRVDRYKEQLETTNVRCLGKDELFEEIFKCDKCGSCKIFKTSKFCGHCGRKIEVFND